MKAYKIQRDDGLFSTGGNFPSFHVSGKTWFKLGHVKSHITNTATRLAVRGHWRWPYENARVVEYELTDTGAYPVDLAEYAAQKCEAEHERFPDPHWDLQGRAALIRAAANQRKHTLTE